MTGRLAPRLGGRATIQATLAVTALAAAALLGAGAALTGLLPPARGTGDGDGRPDAS